MSQCIKQNVVFRLLENGNCFREQVPNTLDLKQQIIVSFNKRHYTENKNRNNIKSCHSPVFLVYAGLRYYAGSLVYAFIIYE